MMFSTRMQYVQSACVLVLLVCIISGQTCAQRSSHVLSFQGRLAEPSGRPVPDGLYPVQFTIYDGETGGTALWQETQNATQVGGVFNAYLGTVTGFPAGLFAGGDRWLALRIVGDQEMVRRYRIAPAAFAIYADDADKVDGFHASATPTPSCILPLGSEGRFPLSAIPNGPGSGMNADLLDDKDGAAYVTRPVQTEDIADGAVTQAKLGEGLSVQHADEADNADKVDGKDAADFAAADHNHDALYVNEGQPDSVTSPMIADGEVRTGDLADAAVTQAKIASGLSVQHAVEADHAARAAVADEALHARDSDMLGGIPAEGFVAKGEPGCISAEMLQDGSVAQGAIAFGAVTTETRGRSPAIRSFFVALSRNLQNADVCTVPAGVTLIITDIHWAYQIDQGNTTYMYVRDKTAGNDLFVGSGRNSGGNVQEDLMYSFQAGIVVPEGHTLEVTSTSTSQYLYVQFITISGYEIAPEG